MRKHFGKLPVNSACSIDYSKDKPKIKFRYPRKDVVRQGGDPLLLIISMILYATLLISIVC
jgi:hypothetical protein